MADRVNGKSSYFARRIVIAGAETNYDVMDEESIGGAHYQYLWIRPSADCTMRVGATSKDAINLTADEAREFVLKYDTFFLTTSGAANVDVVGW